MPNFGGQYQNDWSYKNPTPSQGGGYQEAPGQLNPSTPPGGGVSGGYRSTPMLQPGGVPTAPTGGGFTSVGGAQPIGGGGGFTPAGGAQPIGAPQWLSQIPGPLQAFYLSQWRANPGMAPPPTAGFQNFRTFGPQPGSMPPVSDVRSFGSGR